MLLVACSGTDPATDGKTTYPTEPTEPTEPLVLDGACAPATGEPTPAVPMTLDGDAWVLGVEGSLAGGLTSRTGTDVAFACGEMVLGAPSESRGGEPGDQADDVAWRAPDGVTGTILSPGFDPALNPGTLVVPELQDPEQDKTATDYVNQFGSFVLSPGDVTGDGAVDVAVSEGYDEPGYGGYAGRWKIFEGPEFTTGFFVDDWRTGGRGTPCGDLDGDHLGDLCTGGGVVFGPIATGDLPELTWDTTGLDIAAALDADGDGVRDLVIGDVAAHAVYLLAAPGRDGHIVPPAVAATTWLAITGMPTALGAGDLDDDGVDDLVLGWSDGTGDRVLVGLDLAGGTPDAAARTTIAMRGEDVAVGDFDGDGRADLAVGGGAEVAIWLGPLPAGPLTVADAAIRYRGLQYPDDAFGSALDAADGDGDGRADLAIGAPLDATPSSGEPLHNGRAWRLPGGGL